jgi:ribokinase
MTNRPFWTIMRISSPLPLSDAGSTTFEVPPLVKVVVAGAINWDINLFVQRFPRPGEEIPVARIAGVPGGKAGNVSVAAARLLGRGQVGIIGSLGLDGIADKQIRLFENEGVETSAISRKANVESGQAYIVTEQSGENIVHTYGGANMMLEPTDVNRTEVREMIQSAAVAVITDPPQLAVEAVTGIAHESGRLVAWDPGFRAEAGMRELRRALLCTSYLFLNEAEVEYMTGVREPEEAAKRLSAINPDMTSILKSGREGFNVFGPKATTRIPGIDLEEWGLKVVNTVGCGDAFLGAFSAAKALKLEDEEALNWANWAGALKATKSETRGSPTRRELEEWMSRTGSHAKS